jgi:hypothetical protein
MAGSTATVVITCNGASFTNLGTGPLYVSTQGPILIAVSSTQPSPDAAGHFLNNLVVPFYFELAEQVWALSLSTSSPTTDVTVSATTSPPQ